VKSEAPPSLTDFQKALLGGAVAGAALSGILSPLELLKCRVQAGEDASVAAAARRVLFSHGPRGLLRGLGPTLCRELPGNALFFASYEALQRQAARLGCGDSPLAAPVCGGLSGVFFWACVLPMDTAKTRIQCLSPGQVGAEMGLVATLRSEWAAKGLAGWYAGARPMMLRAFVANAAQWACWDWGCRVMRTQWTAVER
jgi:hypothetical protein